MICDLTIVQTNSVVAVLNLALSRDSCPGEMAGISCARISSKCEHGLRE